MDNLLALLTALGGLAGLVSALASARNAVKQSDLQALRDTIAALEAENTCLRACITALEADRDADRIKNSRIRRAWRSGSSAYSTVSRTISLIDLP